MGKGVVAGWDLDPVHTDDLSVNHESQGIRNVAFKGRNDAPKQIPVRTLSPFEDACGEVRSRHSMRSESTHLEL